MTLVFASDVFTAGICDQFLQGSPCYATCDILFTCNTPYEGLILTYHMSRKLGVFDRGLV